ncbi:hypothetical protein SMMN14_00084, partial [Sphaerulina musiva]
MALFYHPLPFHPGEISLHYKLHISQNPDFENPTIPHLSPLLSRQLQISPLIALGTLDCQGWPVTTLLGKGGGGGGSGGSERKEEEEEEEEPLAQPLGRNGVMGIKSQVEGLWDPVVEVLVGGKDGDGDGGSGGSGSGSEKVVVRREEEGKGRMISGLTIDLERRKRVKFFGRMVVGALGWRRRGRRKGEEEGDGREESIAEMQLVLKVEQSLGNCPKYLNKRHIKPAISKPKLLSTSTHLSPHALQLISKADLFFISSANNDLDMDTNHRGGPPGFLRVASHDDENNSESATVLCWPEYSGNRLYQTLGNLAIYPKAGLCIPDFDTGDCLYLSGTTEILVGSAAEEFLPHSNLCVKFFVVSLRLVEHALPFRGVLGEKSIYHPRVRRLAVERFAASAASATTGELQQQQEQQQQATLLHQTKLTPTISRFRFRLHQPNTTTTSPTAASTYQPGQYITLDFSSHLNIGYSHMRDDDPRSLNDDFVRTFTVSGFYQHQHQQQQDQQKEEALGKCGDEFEITIRKVVGGVVTNFLWGYGDDDESQNQYKREKGKEDLVIDVKGFGGGGGEFTIQQQEEQQYQQEQQKNTRTPTKTEKKRRIFIAAGIGITPLIPFLSTSSSSSSSSSSFLNLNLKILWTVKMEDLAFVWDVVGKVAKLELEMEMGQEGLSKKKKEKGKGKGI